MKQGKQPKPAVAISRWRYYLVVTALATLPVLLIGKIAALQVLPQMEQGVDFLQTQGDRRTIRTETIPAHRGVIRDRNGEILAVSTPVVSISADPRELNKATPEQIAQLAAALGDASGSLQNRLQRYQGKAFMYLERQLSPEQAAGVLDLNVPGVFGKQEFKRFYPAGEVAAQLVGYTDIDDLGQGGMELAYDEWLTGVPGAKQVMKDRNGRFIKDLALLREAKPGKDIVLSLDLRVQYIAYRGLAAALKKHQAKSGSVVVVDVETGEVIAMVNLPAFNPNDRARLNQDALRNRAITDVFEPGSTVKPFTLLAALESGKYSERTKIDTNPGYLKVSYKTYTDHRNYGVLDLRGILAKSSQVGTTKIAMNLDPFETRALFERVGFGENPGTGFPGESGGNLPIHEKWHPVEQASFAFGYGLAVTPLQLANAYTVLARDGIYKPLTLLHGGQSPAEQRLFDASQVAVVRDMLASVTEPDGTGSRANIPAYSEGGKTGTSHIYTAGGYMEDRYVSAFAGMAPLQHPKLVTVVMINDPRGDDHFGGLVAAPVFSQVTGNALRLLQVPPDQPSEQQTAFARLTTAGVSSGGGASR